MERSALQYVLWTNPTCEEAVCKTLSALGFETFFPRIFERNVVNPLFPRYAFITNQANEWHDVFHTRGLCKVLGYPGPPAALPVGFVAALRAQCDIDGVMRTHVSVARSAQVGDYCRVTAGPFKGFEGLAQRAASQRITLLLSLFGSHRQPVHVDLSAVEVI